MKPQIDEPIPTPMRDRRIGRAVVYLTPEMEDAIAEVRSSRGLTTQEILEFGLRLAMERFGLGPLPPKVDRRRKRHGEAP